MIQYSEKIVFTIQIYLRKLQCFVAEMLIVKDFTVCTVPVFPIVAVLRRLLAYCTVFTCEDLLLIYNNCGKNTIYTMVGSCKNP